MGNLFVFFRNIQELKEKKRRGWLLHQIKDSENTSSHIFRMAILAWLLGRKKGLNIEKVIKMALIHDIGEALTFDETPYDPLLPRETDSAQTKSQVNNILQKWPKFTLEQKKEKVSKKEQREYQALKKILSDLPLSLREEMENLWLDFEKGFSKEARFVKQIDKAENFLQGFEYWEKYGRIQIHLWIRWIKEIFDDPLLISFEEAIERRFIKKSKDRKKDIDKLLDFLIEIGELKNKERPKWIFRKVPNPEKIADHSFATAIMAWVFSKDKNLNQRRLLKMALIHELSKVYAESTRIEYTLSPNLREEIRKMINEPSKFSPLKRGEILKELQKKYKKWPKLSKKKKEKIFEERYKKEKKSLEKLTFFLPKELKEEIRDLWNQYRRGLTREGRFLQQIDITENFFQALKYYQADKNFPIESWWNEIGEKIEEPILLNFIESLNKKVPF